MQQFSTINIEYLHPSDRLDLFFVVPRNFFKTERFIFSSKFSQWFFIYLTIMVVIFTFFMLYYENLVFRKFSKSLKIVCDTFFRIWQIMLSQSVEIGPNFFQRNLYGSALIFFFFMGQFLEADFTSKIIAYDDEKNNINTLDQYYDSNLGLSFYFGYGHLTFASIGEPDCQDTCVRKKIIDRMASQGIVSSSRVLLANEIYAEILAEMHMTKKYLSHKVPEVFFSSQLSMAVSKSFPWKRELNSVIIALQENGLTSYYSTKIRELKEIIKIRRTLLGFDNSVDDYLIGLWELKSAFILFFVLNGVATILFIVEVNHKRLRLFLVEVVKVILKVLLMIIKIFYSLLLMLLCLILNIYHTLRQMFIIAKQKVYNFFGNLESR